MLHKVNDLLGDTITASDGEIGKMDDVYFDDQNWRVRWFVVDTSRWLEGRKVLISPASVDRSKSSERALAVGLTREQVEHSPRMDADRPIAREYEEAYARYYGVSLYWSPPEGSGLSTRERAARRERKVKEAERKAEESNLRSSGKIIGYSIQASDGEIGHVEDLRVDDSDWAVADLVVDTHAWLPGKKVLVPPSAVEDIDWSTREVRLRMTREDVKRACPAA